METMRLGYLVPQFPGQTHIFFWREIRHLERLGVRVSIVSTRPPPRRLMAHSWTAEAMARTTYLGAPRAGGTLRRLPGLPFWDADVRGGGGRLALELVACADPAQRLLEVCSASGITHLHVHSCGRAALTACLARRSGGPPYSLTLHGPLGDYGPGQRLKWRHAAFATIITRRLVAEVAAELGAALTRTVVQPMGVDTDVFARPSPYRLVKPGEPLRLFSCGRLNRVKGHQDLLVAVRLLLDRGRDVRLAIAGEDDDGGTGFRRELEARVAGLGLGDQVTLLGAVGESEVRRHMLEAHLFVLASWHEPLGVVYMEAMSCEVPTIGTDAGGVSELIEHGKSGWLVQPQDPPGLAAAVEAVAADRSLALRLSQGGRRRVVSDFRASNGARTIVEEIRRLGAAAA